MLHDHSSCVPHEPLLWLRTCRGRRGLIHAGESAVLSISRRPIIRFTVIPSEATCNCGRHFVGFRAIGGVDAGLARGVVSEGATACGGLHISEDDVVAVALIHVGVEELARGALTELILAVAPICLGLGDCTGSGIECKLCILRAAASSAARPSLLRTGPRGLISSNCSNGSVELSRVTRLRFIREGKGRVVGSVGEGEGHDGLTTEDLRVVALTRYISGAASPRGEVFFEEEIVGSSSMIMLVTFQALLHVICVELIMLKRLQDLCINGDRVVAYHDPIEVSGFLEIVPRMVTYIRDSESVLRVGVKNLLHEILALGRHEARDLIVRI